MLVREKAYPRLGDLGALVRASRSAESPADAALPTSAQGRKRRLIAMFCRMLGEQMLDGKPITGASDRPPLSPRQRQTLELLLDGKSEKEIAHRLTISRHTVHVYVKSLYKQFDVCSRAELLARWVQR
jgi:DNA-binding CsgD family transcriptional regulator